MRIVSWNVNGLRAQDKTGGFRRWLDRCDADFVGVQEVRARPEQLPKRLTQPKGWHVGYVSAERKGYSGVGFFSRRKPHRVVTSLGDAAMDQEGRVQLVFLGALVIANVYFPNGNGVNRDNSRVPFKLEFYRRLYRQLDALGREGYRILVMGDFNTAHRDIDLARPKQNQNTSGFLLEERQEFDRWIGSGWVDTFRNQYPDELGHYTWWSQRFGVREKNIGWRIDYVLANAHAQSMVQNAFIWAHKRGSDHCPLGVEVEPSICDGR